MRGFHLLLRVLKPIHELLFGFLKLFSALDSISFVLVAPEDDFSLPLCQVPLDLLLSFLLFFVMLAKHVDVVFGLLQLVRVSIFRFSFLFELSFNFLVSLSQRISGSLDLVERGFFLLDQPPELVDLVRVFAFVCHQSIQRRVGFFELLLVLHYLIFRVSVLLLVIEF